MLAIFSDPKESQAGACSYGNDRSCLSDVRCALVDLTGSDFFVAVFKGVLFFRMS
jgi:hypothetical protein